MAKTTKAAETAPQSDDGVVAQALVEQQARELELYDPGEDAGAGMENVSMDERKLPFLRILDPKSPQCKPPSQGGLPGARGGALLNTSTEQVYDGEIGGEFVASYRDQKYVEYIKRNEDGSGGGFVGVMEPDAPRVLELRAKYGKFGKLPMGVDPQGKVHELAQSFYLYGTFYPPEEDPFRCILGFASTQIKKYQTFIERSDAFRYPSKSAGGAIIMVQPPIWMHRWRLQTVYESKGTFSWYGYKLSLAEKNEDGSEADKTRSRMSLKDPRYVAAKEFYQLIKDGIVKADYQAGAADDPATETTGGQGGGPRGAEPTGDHEEIPY